MNTFKRPTLLVRFRYLHFLYPSPYRKQSSTYSQLGAPLEDCIIPNTDLKGKNPPFLSLPIPRGHDQYLVQPRRLDPLAPNVRMVSSEPDLEYHIAQKNKHQQTPSKRIKCSDLKILKIFPGPYSGPVPF